MTTPQQQAKQDRLVRQLAREYWNLTEDGRVEVALSPPGFYRALQALLKHEQDVRFSE